MGSLGIRSFSFFKNAKLRLILAKKIVYRGRKMCKVKQKCDKTRESMVLKNIWIFAPKKKGKRKLIINFGAKFKCFVRCAIKWDFFWWFSYHCVVLYRNTTMRKSHQKTNDNDNIYYRSKAYLSPIRKKKSSIACLTVCTYVHGMNTISLQYMNTTYDTCM